MAQDPNKPRDDGKVRLPPTDSGMNKTSPDDRVGGKGDKDKDGIALQASKRDRNKDEELLQRARKRMTRCITSESENRKAALDDLRFKDGEGQWPADVAAQRNFDQRPCLTINKLPTFVHQITNDQRQNRPGINISPVGDRSDPEVAKMFSGLIRAIERASVADIAYDTAFESAVSMGWGYWRVLTEYDSPMSFDQVLTIKRIRNPFSVYLDPDCQEPDGSDARYGFITEKVPRSEFKDKWPGADQMSWTERGIGDSDKRFWIEKDELVIAEYFEIEDETRTLVRLDNEFVGWKDELDPEVLDRHEILDEREANSPKVYWYKLTGVEVLDETPWLGQWVPIIRTIGNEIDIDGKVRLSGVIRNAKSPQLMYNYMRPVSIDTPLPTPSGWTTMGEVSVGDTLLDERGMPCEVIGVSPVHLYHDCYRVRFDDGTDIIADAEHPWRVEERGKRKAATWDWSEKTLATRELKPKKHFIYTTAPLELPEVDLPIHPYLLGAWLGDGTSVAPEITCGAHDIEEMREIIASFGYNVGMARQSKERAPRFTIHGIRSKLHQLGVLGNKQIPAQYLRASREQREWLLRGLMDTDGTIGPVNPQCSFTTTSAALAEGFAELVRTLGIKALSRQRAGYTRKFPNGGTYDCAPSVVFSFSCADTDYPFVLLRKRVKTYGKFSHRRRTKRHSIVAVDRVASVPVRCVKVDCPSHLFLAGVGMVPTHNTLSVELTALQPKAPYIVEEGQIMGHEQQWKKANTAAYPYLLYRAVNVNGKQAPPPQRQAFAGAPAAVLQETQTAAQDMMAVTGIRFDATPGERMYDESGRALRELRRSGDLGSFHYVDNLARALRHTGEILVDLIPKIYNTKRILTILREDDTEERVQVDPAAPKPYSETRGQNGKVLKIFNPKEGKYGVTVTIGPSYATKRIEAAESMMDFARAMPQTATLIADLIAKNQDWPGATEMAARLAKAVPPQLLTPDQKDVPPQVQALMQSMDAQIKQLSQERVLMMKQIADQEKDRAQKQDQIDKTFEAKVLSVLATFDAKMAATQQKAESDLYDKVGAPIRELAEHVATLRDALANPEPLAAE